MDSNCVSGVNNYAEAAARHSEPVHLLIKYNRFNQKKNVQGTSAARATAFTANYITMSAVRKRSTEIRGPAAIRVVDSHKSGRASSECDL